MLQRTTEASRPVVHLTRKPTCVPLWLPIFLLVIGTGIPAVGQQVIQATRVATRLSRPVFATAAPGDSSRLFILEQHTGRIEILDQSTGQLLATPYLDLARLSTGGEQGLLGMAFDPNFSDTGEFYVNYTESSGRTNIVRYRVSEDPNVADANSAETILTISQPQSNHNAGWMDFGPDGLLYVAVGDGGSSNDQGTGHTPSIGNGQDLTDNLLGKMLRLDVSRDDFPNDENRNYGIPPTNPFVGADGDDEIWAYGLRNSWRNSFDSLTGDLWIADVGQGQREEINFQSADSTGGENYGWRLREGTIQTPSVGGPEPPDYVGPIYDYRHSSSSTGGFSVTGGYVYRGPLPALQGHYFFADFVSNQVWSLRFDGEKVVDFQIRTDQIVTDAGSLEGISSFGEDHEGNLYVVSLSGSIFRFDNVTLSEQAGDYNGNAMLDAADLDELTLAIRRDDLLSKYDLNLNGVLDAGDRTVWIADLKSTWLGDSDLDGEFNEADLVRVFQVGEYEDAIASNSRWETGDWNGDLEFDTSDLVAAFIDGGYGLGPRGGALMVPEPGLLGSFIAGMGLAIVWRPSRGRRT